MKNKKPWIMTICWFLSCVTNKPQKFFKLRENFWGTIRPHSRKFSPPNEYLWHGHVSKFLTMRSAPPHIDDPRRKTCGICTCLASNQSMGGQPDFGKVAFADAPIYGVEPDGVRLAVHVGGGGGGGSRRPCLRGASRPSCSRAALAVARYGHRTGGVGRGYGADGGTRRWRRATTAVATGRDPHSGVTIILTPIKILLRQLWRISYCSCGDFVHACDLR